MRYLLIVATLCSLVACVTLETRYVTPNGLESLPCGSLETPCKSFSLAVSSVASSTDNIIIEVANGIYDVAVATSTSASHLTIVGNGAIFRCSHSSSFLSFSNGILFISNLTIANCLNANGGALSLSSVTYTIRDSVFMNNSALTSGGAIDCTSTCVGYLIRSQFLSNSVSSAATEVVGGAISSPYGSLDVADSYFAGNSVLGSPTTVSFSGSSLGGAVSCESFNASRSVFANNVAGNYITAYGGALYASTLVSVYNCNFTGNAVLTNVGPTSDVTLAAHEGGGGGISSQFVQAFGCHFVNNSVHAVNANSVQGGGIAGGANVMLSGCLFDSNSIVNSGEIYGAGNAYGGAANLQDNILVTQCTFVNNLATVASSGFAAGGALGMTEGVVTHSRFFSNRAIASSLRWDGLALGGALATTNRATLIVSCQFGSNVAYIALYSRAQGGAVYALDGIGGVVHIADSSFYQNMVQAGGNYGGALGGAVSAQLLYVNNSVFSGNWAAIGASGLAEGGAIYSISSTLVGSTFSNNYLACQQTAGTCLGGSVYGADTTVYSSQFLHSAIQAGRLGFVAGGCIASTTVTINGSSFENNNIFATSGDLLGGSIAYSVSSSISHSAFVNSILSAGAGDNIYGGAVGWLGYSNPTYEAYFLSSLDPVLTLSYVNMTNCAIRSTSSNRGGCIAAPTVQIVDSSLTGCNANYGGSLFLSPFFRQGGQITLAPLPSNLSSVVFSGSATLGGGIFGSFVAFNLDKCQFDGCAVTQQGASVYLHNFSNVTFVGSPNVFRNNWALAGAVVFWDNTGVPPFVPSSQIASDNNFAYYGNITASFPVAAKVSNNRCGGLLQPGCLLEVSVYVIDAFNQTIFTEAAGVLQVVFFGQSCIPPQVNYLNGVMQEPIQLAAVHPHDFLQGTVFTRTTVYTDFIFNVSFLNEPFQGCSIGSVLSHISQSNCRYCQTCEFSTYSLAPNAVSCYSCASSQGEAQCQGSSVVATQGWWLYIDPYFHSVQSVACPTGFCATAVNSSCSSSDSFASCLSVFQMSQNAILYYSNSSATNSTTYCDSAHVQGKVNGWCEPMNLCAKNRRGWMCADCLDEDYSEWNGKCIDCSEPQSWLLALVVLGYWVEVLVLYMLLSNKASVATKILIYFVQVALLIATPSDPIAVALSVINIDIQSSSSICLFRRSFFEAFIQQVFVLPSILLLQILISFSVYAAIQSWRRQTVDKVRWLVRPLIALLLALYTPVSTAVISMLSCEQVGSYYVVSAAPSYLCQGVLHLPYLIVAIVLAIVFILGVPVLFAGLLFRSRRQLHLDVAKSRLGYLYEAYIHRYYWWEIAVLVRRTLLSTISITLTATARSMSLALVCLGVALAHAFALPNMDELSNKIELISLLSLVFLTVLNTGYFADNANLSAIAVFQDAIIGTVSLFLLAFAVYMSRTAVMSVWATIKEKVSGKQAKNDKEENTSLQESLLAAKDEML